MNFKLSEENEQMKTMVRNFVDKEVDLYANEIEETEEIPKHLIDKAKELGLFGLSIPEEYGASA